MYLFTRQTRLATGHLRDGMEWAVGLTEKVNQITSLNVGLWTKMLSGQTGTLSWGSAVESLVDLEDANAKMMVDDILMDMAARGAELTTGVFEDQTAQFVHNDVDASSNPGYVYVVQAQLANGAFQRGVEAGIEIAQRAKQLGGQPTSFLIGTTGAFGAVAWITSAATLKELEQADQAVNMNPDFIKFLDDEAASCYLPGTGEQSIWQRIV
jgi:hypothetical protein